MLLVLLAAAALAAPPKAITGDFDRDGRPDRAWIARKPGGFDIVVQRGADPHHPVVIHSERGDPRNYFLNKAVAGRWRSACAKGYDIDDAGCLTRMAKTKGGELTFGQSESTEFVALWGGGRFVVIQISD